MPQDDKTISEREQIILQAIVRSYITTAEPVGSRAIVKRFELDLSPATVRNVMADLEEAGYLQQLHTSSGRVPTDRGYRYYVDYLMRVQELTAAERTRIETELSRKLDDANEVLRQTSQLLALITHQTGIVKAPDQRAGEVRYVEVAPVATTRAAVLVADSYGRVHTVMIPLVNPLSSDEATKLNAFLNEHLRGAPLDQFASTVKRVMASLLDENRRLAERALQLVNLMPTNRPSQLYLEGASRLFEQPEFRDVEKAREVFGFLEERERLLEVLRTNVADSDNESSVVIGSESHDEGLKDISVVASPYRVGDKTVGVLGILGPRRMPYHRLTSIVEYTAGMLSRMLTKLAG